MCGTERVLSSASVTQKTSLNVFLGHNGAACVCPTHVLSMDGEPEEHVSLMNEMRDCFDVQNDSRNSSPAGTNWL